MSLLTDMESTFTATPTLWWLGGMSYAIRYASITFYVNPEQGSAMRADACSNADLVLCTEVDSIDPVVVPAILAASPRAKVVLPKSAKTDVVPLDRMTTTDNGLRVEFFKDNLYGRVYSVPGDLAGYTPIGGYPKLGYLIRFEGITVYFAGRAGVYDGLADRILPYNPTVAILSAEVAPQDAALLAKQAGVRWLVPAMPDERFVQHLLGHWPEQRFKIFSEPGEKWTVPANSAFELELDSHA